MKFALSSSRKRLDEEAKLKSHFKGIEDVVVHLDPDDH